MFVSGNDRMAGPRCGSAAARLLGLWVQMPLGAWMAVRVSVGLLLGRGLCFGLITRPEESYRMWCVWVWSWSSIMRRPWPTRGPLGFTFKNCRANSILYFECLQCGVGGRGARRLVRSPRRRWQSPKGDKMVFYTHKIFSAHNNFVIVEPNKGKLST